MTGTMRFLPVVARELGAIARRPSAYWIRSGAALAAFLAMGWVALLGLRVPLLEQGRNLFQLLSLGGFIYCLVAGIRGTSDALSEEKREGTLGLLFLTDLKGYDVVFGKFVSLSINSFYGILAIVPALALAFLLGGTSLAQFLMMSLCLINTLFFSLAAGLLVSTFCQNERAAMSGTLAILFTISVAPYAIAVWHTFGILELGETLFPGFLLCSPAFTFHTASNVNLVRILQEELLLSSAFIHLTAWLCLVIASASIARRAHADSPRGRFLTWFAQFRNRLAYGKAQHRYAIRSRTLDRNAFFWLASRDRLKRRYAWTFIILLGIVWCILAWTVPDLLTDWPVILGSLWFLHLFFKVWFASEVASRFIEDRRSNALELLLTTPLSVREFAHGQLLALLRQFAGPLAFVIFLNLVATLRARGSFGYAFQSTDAWQFFIIGIIHLALDFYTVLWVAIWRSQRLRGANRTILQTIFFVIVLPVLGLFLLIQIQWIQAMLFSNSTPSTLATFWRWTILSIIYELALVFMARKAFLRDFREIATQHFDQPAKKSAKKEKAKITRAHVKARALRWATATAIVAVCLLTLASARRNRFSKQVQQRFADIRAQGMPVLPIEIPQYFPAPPDARGVEHLLRAAQKLYIPQMANDSLRYALEQNRPDSAAKAAEFLRRNKAVIDLLQDLPNRTGTRQPIDSRRFGPQELVDLLYIKALLESRENKPELPGTITLLLHFARATEGNFGAQHISKQCLDLTQDLLERGAANRSFTTAQWREWQNILAQFDPLAQLRISLAIERTSNLELFKAPPDTLWRSFGRGTTSFPSMFAFSLAMRRFVGQDQKEILEYLDHMQAAIDACSQPFWTRPQKPARRGWRPSSLASSSIIVPQIAPVTDWILRVANTRVARQRLLQCAAALELYRAENSRLPETLAQTGADKIQDPFNGQPFQYLRSQTGYKLLCAGEETWDGSAPRRRTDRTRRELSFRAEPEKSP